MPVEPRPPAFRRRPFEAPHRRRGPARRLLRPFLAALVLVGAPAAAAGWLLGSRELALSRLEIECGERVSPDWVRGRLEPLIGRHLLGLRFREVERRLAGHPWVRGVQVRKELPYLLSVVVEERRAAARLAAPGGELLVDFEGTVIEPYDPERDGPELPLLVGVDAPAAEVPAALELAAAWRAARGGVALEIERVAESDYRVRTADLPFPVLVAAGDLERALERLERLLPGLARRFSHIEQIDLRFSRQVVIQPAAEPPLQEG